MTEPQSRDRFIPPGTRISYDGLDKGGPEYGVVVHCWNDDEIDGQTFLTVGSLADFVAGKLTP